MTKPVKGIWLPIVDIAIWTIIIVTVLYVMAQPGATYLKAATASGVAVCALIYLVIAGRGPAPAAWLKIRKRTRSDVKSKEIAKLVQLDDDGEPVKEWYIRGETSLLIGKSNARQEAEIDLSDSEYASLISAEHAVLNRVGGDWFVEDIDSTSGTGLRPARKSLVERLQSGELYKLGPGDLLYIANTRLLVK
ncbi:FHA domain-containing protein [Paenibacillus jiagnxiensis]|uniref:FHA domain-containing protein n=1 Tax=Paenibacillus jiagnxiensis TaxID=3228926 RepID=UPI0033AC7BD0